MQDDKKIIGMNRDKFNKIKLAFETGKINKDANFDEPPKSYDFNAVMNTWKQAESAPIENKPIKKKTKKIIKKIVKKKKKPECNDDTN